MRQETINILTISELSKEAKDRAYQDYLSQSSNNVFSSENEASLNQFEAVFPIKVGRWSYDSGGGHIGFNMQTNEEIANMSGIRLLKYLYNNYWDQITKGKYYGKLVNTFKDGSPIPVSKEHPAGLRHVKKYSKWLRDRCCPFTGYYMDDTILEPIFEFMDRPDDTTFEELMDICLYAWITGCAKDMEYQESMAYFVETSEANEWEFMEDGERWYHVRISAPTPQYKRA